MSITPSQNRIRWENLPASSLQHQEGEFLKEWDRLNGERGDLAIMAGYTVVSALSAFGTSQERLLVGRNGTAIVAMAILAPAGILRWQTFQPSQLPLGTWVAQKSLTLQDLSQTLLRGPLGLCLALSITQVDPLVAARQVDMADTRHSDYVDTGWIDIAGDFDDYWHARGKNLRQNMRKQRTRLAADGVKLSLDVLRDKNQMAAAIAQYGQLESNGWKASEGTAIHPDNVQGRFYLSLMESASLHGQAVIYIYRFDDRAVAMNICLQRTGVLIVLKTTYDETIKTYSPAFLMQESVLQMLHAEGEVHRLEYFGRMMDWHTKWTECARLLYHFTSYRAPFVKKFAMARQMKSGTVSAAPDKILSGST